MPASLFYNEIMDQPAALQRVIDAYASPERWAGLPACGERPLLVGMGASYHAARLGAHFLEQQDVAAQAREAAELLYADSPALREATALVYVSQSGASGEVAPLLKRRAIEAPVIALTNNMESHLSQHAYFVLPLLAGEEQTVATKTYANAVALLWLLARHWGRASATSGGQAAMRQELQTAQQRLTELLAQSIEIARRWIEHLGSSKSLVFVGAGPQAVTARQCAMMVMEWLKVPALSANVGAFRHGPLEIVEPGLGAVLFAAPGPAYESTVRLAEELESYGATVVRVECGQSIGLDEPAETTLEPALAPLVDVVPVQLFVEALARERGLPGEFRRISKVMKVV